VSVVAPFASGSCAFLRIHPVTNTHDRRGTKNRPYIDENRALKWCKHGRYDQLHGACIAADFEYLVRVFSNVGFNWPRRQTLAFVAFALIVVAFTALALSWNGLSVFRNSATAEPGLGPYAIAFPAHATPSPTPSLTPHPTDATTTSVTPGQTPLPTPSQSPKAKPAVKAKAKHRVKPKAKPKATHTPKPKPTRVPKVKSLYIHTPVVKHLPKRKAQYPPAAPLTTVHGVLAGAAGQNYVAR
jgi:hypothetical protein